MLNVNEISNFTSTRSAWSKGVALYAADLIETYNEMVEAKGHEAANVNEAEKWLLKGASTWKKYSYGGCTLCCGEDIAERLCNKSELKKTCNGMKKPNAAESWLDVQARALYQASQIVLEMYKKSF